MKENEVEINEELVEEIMMILLEYAKALSSGMAKHDYETRLEKRTAELIIARILSAVCDGQKIPGKKK